MLVKQAMNRKVVVTKPDVTVKEAAQIMSKFRIGCLVVLEGEKIVGIITERDVLRKVVATGLDASNTKIEQVMTKEVITIDSDKSIEDACSLMTEHDIKKLPVLEEGKLIGIITATDLISVQPKMIEALAKIMLFAEKKAVAG